MSWHRKNGRKVWVEPTEVDDSPLYRVKVNPDGTLDHTGAFDPRYEQECVKCGERRLMNEEGCTCSE